MDPTQKRTVSLTAQHGAYIDAKIESGAYASASEVVRAGLRALKARDAAFEKLLREQVLPVHDHLLANPETARSPDQVMERIRAHHERRTRDA